jgi:hypothetical protein
MTVAELIAQLQACDPALQVKLPGVVGPWIPPGVWTGTTSVGTVSVQARTGTGERAAESWVMLQPRATL